jgi:hypothetical protein
MRTCSARWKIVAAFISKFPPVQISSLPMDGAYDRWKHRKTLRASSELEGNSIFQEINKRLLIVSDAATALIDTQTYHEDRLTDAAPPSIHEITVPRKNDRWVPHEARSGSGLQLFVVTTTILIVLGLGPFGGWSLYRYFGGPDEVSGSAVVNALVERIMAVESNGDPNAKNSRSSLRNGTRSISRSNLD